MFRHKNKIEINDPIFWDGVATKLVATFISVKVWGLFVTWTLSSIFLYNNFITGTDWVTINSAVTSVIYGTREIFKIASVRQYLEPKNNNNEQADI